MAGLLNGGMLYHEIQEAKLCALHCLNTVLQGPFFTEVDLAAIASVLDQEERQMMLEGTGDGWESSGDFYTEDSHNVSMGGDFSIQVMERALAVWELEVIPLSSPVAEPSTIVPELENAFICHLQDHWFCIRKVNGEWYNFNSLLPAPEHLSEFYLSACIDSLKDSGWSIFLVKGYFPKDFPGPRDVSVFGQWLTPEDAKDKGKSCKQMEEFTQDLNAEQEEKDLNAAIQASLMDSTGYEAIETATITPKLESVNKSTQSSPHDAERSLSNTDVPNVTSGAET